MAGRLLRVLPVDILEPPFVWLIDCLIPTDVEPDAKPDAKS